MTPHWFACVRLAALTVVTMWMQIGCIAIPESGVSSNSPSIVSIGTDSQRAMEIMRKAGFRTRIVEKGQFKYQERDGNGDMNEHNVSDATYIRCSIKLSHPTSIITSVKIVFLVLDGDNRVSAVYERVDNTGL